MQLRVAFVSLALVVSLSGFGGNDTITTTDTATPTPSPVTATVGGVSAEGSTATAVPSPDAAYQWSATFTVTLTETAGVATTVRSLAATLQQAAGGIIITPPSGLAESYRYNVRAGTNQLGANGTLPLDFDFFYTLPNGGRQALVTITFTLVNANGAQSQLVATVNVV